MTDTIRPERAFAMLEQIAEAAAADISGDFPGLETGYDLYVESLDVGVVGVVDMGDAYQGVFVWDDPSGEWQVHNAVASDVRDAILEKRGARL